MKKTLLIRTVNTLVDLHGSYRKAGKKLGIHWVTLFRIVDEQIYLPRDETLEKLGLERIPNVDIVRKKQ